MSEKHTPPPWMIGGRLSIIRKITEDEFEVVLGPTKTPSAEDIEVIVRAVNSHQALLKAANEMYRALELAGMKKTDVDTWKTAIANAEGEQP